MYTIKHGLNTDLNAISHNLSAIISIKLSRAKERHASAMGFNSYNHLLSTIPNGEVEVNTRCYINALRNELLEHHKKNLSDEEAENIVTLLTNDKQPTATFLGFLRYAITVSRQSNPAIPFCFSEFPISQSEDECDLFLNKFISEGKYLDELASITKKVLPFLRRRMKKVSDPIHGVFRAKHLIEEYAKGVLKYDSPDFIHIFYFPLMLVRRDEWDEGLLVLSKSSIKSLMSKDRDSLISNKTTPFNILFNDDDEDETPDFNKAIYTQETLLQPCPLGRFDDVRYFDDDEGITVPMMSSVNTKLPKGVLELPYNKDIYLNATSNDDGGEFPFMHTDGREEFSDGEVSFHAMTLITIGEKPTVKELKAFQEQVQADSIVSSIDCIGEAVEVMDNEDSLIGGKKKATESLLSLIASYIHKNPNNYLAFSNIKDGYLARVNSKIAHSPYGDEYDEVSSTFYGFTDAETNFEGCLNDIVMQPVIDLYNYKFGGLKTQHCYFDNIASMGRCEDGCDIFEVTSHTDSYLTLVKELPFSKCKNVYCVLSDNGCSDSPFYIVGFDGGGEQIINITLYPFYAIQYQQKEFNKVEEFYEKIRQAIQGKFEQFDNEIANYFYKNRKAISPELTEVELSTEVFLIKMKTGVI